MEFAKREETKSRWAWRHDVCLDFGGRGGGRGKVRKGVFFHILTHLPGANKKNYSRHENRLPCDDTAAVKHQIAIFSGDAWFKAAELH